jgi:hypothetical protein
MEALTCRGKPQVTVTRYPTEIFVRRNKVLVAHAVRRDGTWQCFRVHGGNGPAPAAEYVDSVRGPKRAADFMVGLVA